MTDAGGDCSFSPPISNFDTFSGAQFFAFAPRGNGDRGDTWRRVSNFPVQRCKALVPIWVRARANDGAISDIFFHHRRRYTATESATTETPFCLRYGSMSSPTRRDSPRVARRTLISHLYQCTFSLYTCIARLPCQIYIAHGRKFTNYVKNVHYFLLKEYNTTYLSLKIANLTFVSRIKIFIYRNVKYKIYLYAQYCGM